MEFKIVEYWLRNKENTYTEIAGYFNVTAYYVQIAIDKYIKEPYVIRQSKMNYE
jgi:hypothetical protein